MAIEVFKNKCIWVVKNFPSLGTEKIYSEEFVIDGCKWRLMAFPKGNKCPGQFSLYLVCVDIIYLQSGGRRRTKVCFTIVNHFSEKLSEVKGSTHWFEKNSTACGFTRMIDIVKLVSVNGEFLVDGELKIVVQLKVLNVVGELDVPTEAEERTQPRKKIKLTSTVEQSIDVNGFHVLRSQVDFVKRIFEKYPDVALEVRHNNPILKTAYMNVLLRLTKTLCRPVREISKDDLTDAYDSLRSLKDVGFKLDWLEKKLKEVPKKKQKEEAAQARMREIEQELKDLKAKVLALRAPLKFDDVFS